MRNEEFIFSQPMLPTDPHRRNHLCDLWQISSRSEKFAAEEAAVEDGQDDEGDDGEQREWEG